MEQIAAGSLEEPAHSYIEYQGTLWDPEGFELRSTLTVLIEHIIR
jgi:hypothetical protein